MAVNVPDFSHFCNVKLTLRYERDIISGVEAQMKKQLAAATTVVAALFLSASIAWANGTSEKGTPQPTSLHGVVEYYEGDVTINGSPVDFGQTVKQGDRVQTGANSIVQIVYNQKNIFELQQNTIAIINIGDLVKRIQLRTGTFAGVFADLEALGGATQVQVQTPTAVGAVRGTTFFVKVIDPDTTYICDCNGVVEMKGAQGSDDHVVQAPSHEAYLYTMTNGSVSASKAPEEYHTSADMDALASKIGVTIPWGTVE